MKRAPAPPEGFTLIEMLIALSLFAAVLGTIAATFFSGTTVLRRIQCQGFQDQELLTTMERIRKDFSQYHNFRPVPFDGSYEKIQFPALTPAGEWGENQLSEPGRLAYFHDRRKDLFCRSTVAYRALRSQRYLEDSCSPLMEDVSRVHFSYFGMPDDAQTYSWSGSWKGATPPRFIKLELEYKDACSDEKIRKTAVFPIPGPRAG